MNIIWSQVARSPNGQFRAGNLDIHLSLVGRKQPFDMGNAFLKAICREVRWLRAVPSLSLRAHRISGQLTLLAAELGQDDYLQSTDIQ